MRFIIQDKFEDKKIKSQFIFEVETWRGSNESEIFVRFKQL